MARMKKKWLTDSLLKKGLLKEEDLRTAQSMLKGDGARIEDILVEKGYVTDRNMMAVTAELLNIPFIDLTKYKMFPDVVELLSKEMATHLRVMPLARIGDVLSMAMADPLDVVALDDMKLVTGLSISPVISTTIAIREAISNYYADFSGMESMLEKAEAPRIELKRDRDDEEIDLDALVGKSEEFSIVKLVNLLLVQGIKARASDIHVEPFEKTLRLRYRIDGILYESSPLPKHMQAAIASRIKVMSNLDIAQRRLPQDGRFRIKIHGRDIDFRVSCLPTYFGEKVVMRILDKSAVAMDLDKLGFHKEGLEIFRKGISSPYGMLLLTGPTGSGKTTTLYSALMEINTPEVNIITVEDPVEYQLMGVNQVSVKPSIGLTFAAGLRSILRQDPDIIMIGEVRDHDTADIAVKSALTGHLVLSTLHTNDAAGAIARLDDMGIEPFLISSSVILVAAQRLVRRICTRCKEPVEVPASVLRHAQMKVDHDGKCTIFHGRGCKACNKTGYAGRLSLLEVLSVNDDIRELIIGEANASRIKAMAMEKGMKTLRMVGLDRVMEGLTTLDEVLRVTAAD
ncbi:MAG: ATPase, T2SS/T4P/T4SS family [Candidatus Tritonobacter lacicola]|nr:ATPase, T2SS/T4P/T4SS family [Candidatus Tritonobacter lacicola]